MKANLARIYFYKLVADNGGAPCVRSGLLSLAICKPMIRSTAREDDLIFGFAANALDAANPLIYVARITSKLKGSECYSDSRYAMRDDRIYAQVDGRFERRPNAKHHHRPGDLVHDLGPFPRYPRAYVLLSDDFRYFGKRGTDEYKRWFPAIQQAVENLKQGHRVNHSSKLREELIELRNRIWRKHADQKVLGRPTSQPNSNVCHRDGPTCVVRD